MLSDNAVMLLLRSAVLAGGIGLSEKETKKKLLESAKKEFLEKGYMHASLRNICKNAGVITGALYFFFRDKKALFAALVDEPLQKLHDIMNLHYQEEITETEMVMEHLTQQDISGDLEAAKQIVHYMYQYYDEFQLILVKGQGSGYESCVDQFVDITEKHYRRFADRVTEQMGIERMGGYILHWMAHMQTDAFVYMLAHEKSEEEAMKSIEDIVQYMVSGWLGLLGQ